MQIIPQDLLSLILRDYYVDKDTGKAYRYTKDNKIMEY